MPVAWMRLTLLAVGLLASLPVFAAKVTKLSIQGLPETAMQDNVRSALSLNGEMGKDLRPRRLNYLLDAAEQEARTALEPFGYYSPIITIQRSDRSAHVEDAEDNTQPAAKPNDAPITVTLNIQLGPPVKVRNTDIGIDGPARDASTLADALAAFQPKRGDVFNHSLYEASKAQINRRLADIGYFDADLTQHSVTVSRADGSADIALHWNSGPRYRFGDAHFNQIPQPILRDTLLHNLVPWQPGDAYDEAQLDRLRQSLVALDYFSLIDVQAAPNATEPNSTPIHIELTPAKRSIYSAGANYGTLSGTGFSLGVERRYLNSRGHKALSQIDWGNKRKAATVQYRIPAFAWRDGWYTASLQAADEQTTYVNSRKLEFVASRSGQYNPFLNVAASLHVLRERWAYYTPLRPVQSFQFASFVFPALQAEYIDVDDRMEPRHGMGTRIMLRGGKGGSDGHATFSQLYASTQWFYGLGANSRLIARGELGHTFTRDVLNLPPSLRFYAGGDRSVRGYGWHEIGPRIITSGGDYFTGAPNLVTASLEYERYFYGAWGAAVFVDSGSAFEGRHADMHTGVGIGLRWRSPVGPVRIDIGRGLKSPDAPFTLHLNIGADL
ncbi:autotransporter assembly complex family protein [Thermomonas sp.]|uniref:autotransporter assembly complex protein TamA n=1 Tax=Thermomonas sp. TaxID=1971895 RepID=UPI0026058F5D|nr:autotransporter assembly complex family protein [Thermomonas sp.]